MADTRAEILLPRIAQRRARGWALRTSGWILRIAGALTGIVSIQASRTSVASQSPGALLHSLPFWARVLVWTGLFLLGTVLFTTGRWLAGRGRQHLARVIDSLDAVIRGSYVLYLRPFADDLVGASMPTATPGSSPFASFILSGRTHEESLSRVFRRFGTMVAVGRPGERLPLPGARRLYLPLDDWQDTVRMLIGRARLVVLGTGPGPGTVWELVEAVKTLPPTRLLLVVYHTPEVYEQFRAAAAAQFAARRAELRQAKGADWSPPALPDYPALKHPDRLRGNLVFKGLIYFDAGWESHFVRFDPTALRPFHGSGAVRKAVRRDITAVLDRLQECDPAIGAAVPPQRAAGPPA